jgi:hypothetical protein
MCRELSRRRKHVQHRPFRDGAFGLRHRPVAGRGGLGLPSDRERQQVAAMVDGVARDFGIGTAQAAGGEGQSAAFSYRKARIAESYASHGYRQAETARALGTDVAGLRRMLRQYGIIEWPEGHKGL